MILNECKILFADDEKKVRTNMGEILSFMCKDVFLAADGKEAIEIYNTEKPDIIILDIEMPENNGLNVAKNIRKNDNKTPIIISTAYSTTEYFLQAVELNLTSYILKPINIENLKDALTKAITILSSQKKEQKEIPKKIAFSEDIYYDMNEKTLYNKGEIAALRSSEVQFLEYLIKHPNRVVSYDEFQINLWEEEVMSGPAIRSLVRDLRKHLPKGTIVNISKIGYKLVIKK